MSIRAHQIPTKQIITNDYFSLSIQKTPRSANITMESLTPFLNTRDIPNICSLAKKHIPYIFFNECFNYDNAPFSKEIKNTEVAHLFEHILLTVLYLLQDQRGNSNAEYKGITSWNWKKEKKGIFHIKISLSECDTKTFPTALQKSITILKHIYATHEAFSKKRQIIN